ncbi:MAG: FecR domain-containing protein [Acidobacteria bacterium]|nr:FecR domain-containing protein [Acidobacteriota bacterium]MBI3655577.1 FecR domain-containing protein [Acidobacteriota bacterium]
MRKSHISDRIDWIFISSRTVWFWLGVVALGLAAFLIYLYYQQEKDNLATVQQAVTNTGIEKKVARVVEIVGDVNVKKVNQLKWIAAREVSQLEEGDLLRTESGSTARLIFFDQSSYVVNPESLISIQKSLVNHANNRREVMVEVTTGGVGVATSKKNAAQSTSGVQTPNASAMFEEFTVGEAKYDRRMNESQFFVYKGSADVFPSTASVPAVHLSGAEEVKVDATNQPREKSALPLPPRLSTPKNMGLFVSSDPKHLKIKMGWDPVPAIRSYRLRVSTTSMFRPLLLQKVFSGNFYEMTMPDYGPYFWRVDSINNKGLESPPGDVFSFNIIPKHHEDASPHDIHLKVNKIIPFGHYFQVVGKTDPGVMVYINDEVVEVKGDGSFKHFTRPYESTGKHTLAVVGRDLSGLNKSLYETVEVK